MLHSLKSRRDAEEGFTLIELMVVVLIIAILIAIAIPTFLGARSRAQDRASQSDLRNGLTAEKTFYTDNESYSADVAAAGVLKGIEPSLPWGATLANGDLVVTVGNVTGTDKGVVCLQMNSKSGATFSLADVSSGTTAGTFYKRGACQVDPTAFTSANNWTTDGW
jgi:type IV pilus assembly protein PilA